jgi:hypothetical protein
MSALASPDLVQYGVHIAALLHKLLHRIKIPIPSCVDQKVIVVL